MPVRMSLAVLLVLIACSGCRRAAAQHVEADASAAGASPVADVDGGPRKAEPGTPAFALLIGRKALERGALDSARAQFELVVKRWPSSAEADQARAELQKLDAGDNATHDQDLADLKGMKRPQTVSVDDVTVKSAGTKAARQWYFDFSPVGNRNATAEKGDAFAILDFDVSSKSKDPDLPCIVAYVRAADSNVFEEGRRLEFRLRRWDSYESQLGLNHDLGNDFAHTDTVKFSGGVAMDETWPRKKFVYFAALRKATLERKDTPHGDYPIEFDGACDYPTRATWSGLKDKILLIDWRTPN